MILLSCRIYIHFHRIGSYIHVLSMSKSLFLNADYNEKLKRCLQLIQKANNTKQYTLSQLKTSLLTDFKIIIFYARTIACKDTLFISSRARPRWYLCNINTARAYVIFKEKFLLSRYTTHRAGCIHASRKKRNANFGL